MNVNPNLYHPTPDANMYQHQQYYHQQCATPSPTSSPPPIYSAEDYDDCEVEKLKLVAEIEPLPFNEVPSHEMSPSPVESGLEMATVMIAPQGEDKDEFASYIDNMIQVL